MVFLFIKPGLGRALGIEKPRHRWIATRTGIGAPNIRKIRRSLENTSTVNG